jgi:hypothetical protein
LHFKKICFIPIKVSLIPSILFIANRLSCLKTILVLVPNSEIGSYFLCKAKRIFTNFPYFYLAILKA